MIAGAPRGHVGAPVDRHQFRMIGGGAHQPGYHLAEVRGRERLRDRLDESVAQRGCGEARRRELLFGRASSGGDRLGDEGSLGGPAAIECGPGDAGRLSDLLERRALEAALGEEFQGGAKDGGVRRRAAWPADPPAGLRLGHIGLLPAWARLNYDTLMYRN